MSCTFWLRRKRLAAERQKAEKLAQEKAVEATVQEEQPKAVKKPAKKAVQKNDSTTD